MENEEAGVLNRLTRHWHVRYVVYGLVDRSVGVKVLTEFHAYRFEPVDEILVGEVLGTVEAHVLEEVSEALSGGLLQG